MRFNFLIVIIMTISFFGCVSTEENKAASNSNTVSVAQLLSNNMYDQEVKVSGTISELGILDCTCFTLSSGGKSVHAWYSMMVSPDRKQRPSVDVSSLKNGTTVTLEGVLKKKERHTTKNDFWIYSIQK